MRAIGFFPWPLVMMAALFILISFRSPHSLVFSITGTFALVSLALCRIQSSPLGVLAPFPIFMLGGALYTLPAALTLAASGTLVSPRGIPTGALMRSALVSSAALLCAAGGYLVFLSCTARRVRLHWQSPSWRHGHTTAMMGRLLMAVGIAAGAHFVFNVVGFKTLRSATYGGRYVLMEGHGLLIGCISLIGLGGLICYAYFLQRNRPLASMGGLLCAGIALGLWTFLTGSRSPLIQFLIAGIVVRQIARKPISLKALAVFGTVLMAAAIFFEMSGRTFSFRAITSLQKDAISRINPANSELGAPMQTLADILQSVPGTEPYKFGATYFEIPAILVPKVFWPDRPQGAGNWYASRFYTSYWESGGGYAFSPIAEAYLNFGPLGIVISFFGIGVVLGALERKLIHHCGLSLWVTIAYAVTVPYILMFFRLDAATLVKSLGVAVLGPLLVCAAANEILREMLRPAKPVASKNSVLGHPVVTDQNQVGRLDTQH